MLNDYTQRKDDALALPPVPRAIAGGFLQPSIEAVEAYGHAVAAPLLSRIAELEQQRDALVEALKGMMNIVNESR